MRHLLRLAALCFLLTGFLPSAPRVQTAFAATSLNPSFGVGSYLATRFADPASLNAAVDVIAQTGAGWVREDFPWQSIEPESGKFQWDFFDKVIDALGARGISVFGVLAGPTPSWAVSGNPSGPFSAPDPQRFAEFASAVAQHFGNRLNYWQIWNEPENPRYWQPNPDSKAYATLLKTVYPAIKAANPNAQVLLGGIVPFDLGFPRALADNGAWNSFDIISVHPYIDPASPEEGQIGVAGIGAIKALSNRFGSKSIWATEFGWATGPSDRDPAAQTDEETQANYLVRSMALLRAAGADKVIWYSIKDVAGNPYGLLRGGNGPTDYSQQKPSFAAFKTLTQQLADTTAVSFQDLGNQQVIADFETFGTWKRGDQPNGELTQSRDQHYGDGNASAKLHYNFSTSGNDFVVFRPSPTIDIPGNPPSRLGIWVKGDGNAHVVRVWLRDAQGEVQFRIGFEGTDWQFLSTSIVEQGDVIGGSGRRRINAPAKLSAIVLDDQPDSFQGQGDVYLDKITAISGPDAYNIRFNKGDNNATDVLWSPGGASVAIATASSQGTLVDRWGTPSKPTASNSSFSLNVGASPVYLSHTPSLSIPVPVPVPTPTPPTGGSPFATIINCDNAVIGIDIPFPPSYKLELVSIDNSLITKKLTYEYGLKGSYCPKTPFSVSPIDDTGTPLKDPSFTIRSVRGSSNGRETKVSSKGELETQIPISGGSNMFGRVVSLTPPGVGAYYTQNSTVIDNRNFGLSDERKTSITVGIKPPKTDFKYLIAIATMTAEVLGFLALVGLSAVGEFSGAVNGLILQYNGTVPHSISASVPGTKHALLIEKQRTSVIPNQPTLDDLIHLYGQGFVNDSTVDVLIIDNQQKGLGETINFKGGNFARHGSIYLSLSSSSTTNPVAETIVDADGDGNIAGQIQIPADAKPGRWLISAIDMSEMYDQLQQFGSGKSTSLHFYLQAANVSIGVPGGASAPLGTITSPDGSFANEAFQTVWQRTDLPVKNGAPGLQARTWIWGPQPLSGGTSEPYAEGSGGSRLVQYFDKSRMEINHPDAPRNQWYVTNGLLVVEMIEGRAQVGDTSFQEQAPADEAVAGDPADGNQNAPTYRSFRSVAYPVNTQHSPNRNGQVVTDVLAKDGTTSQNPDLAHYNVTMDAYDEQLGHNIPKVFTTFFAQQGIVYEEGRYVRRPVIDWLFVIGLPISEPYWARVKIGGVEKDVLMQAFQRRVLTYTPDNAPQWRVEMGNVGQHYLRWRYGS